MTRFILLSFVFLAFAFYELSGGADFDAEELRLSRIDAPEVIEETTSDEPVLASAVAAVPENVTRVALSLTSVNDVLRPANNLRTQRAKVVPAVEEDTQALSEEKPAIILPSLIVDRSVITPVDFGRNLETVQEVAVETGDRSIRAVSGSSVNVRGGPGTNYGVVNRLSRGDQVEILKDPGAGWVQLRPVGGGPVGWMADFLLSDG